MTNTQLLVIELLVDFLFDSVRFVFQIGLTECYKRLFLLKVNPPPPHSDTCTGTSMIIHIKKLYIVLYLQFSVMIHLFKRF